MRHCEQRFVGRLRTVGNGKALACADVQSRFRKNWTPAAVKLLSETCTQLKLVCHVGFGQCVLGNEKNAVFKGIADFLKCQ